MSEQQEDEKKRPKDDETTETPDADDRSDAEPDLRSLLGGSGARRHVTSTEPEGVLADAVREPVAPEDEIAPPYVPPVRPGDPVRPPEREPERQVDRTPGRHPGEMPRRPGEQPGKKQPPVWPGDERQPWFRRERGLPPLPDSQKSEGGGDEVLDPGELPTPLAEILPRGRAWGVSNLLPLAVLFFIPVLGLVVSGLIAVANLFLFRQGQDVGAVIFRLRVVRENGDVAGFFQMFVRNAASSISFLALGAGYWTAFADPARRTWHDKWLGTYVVQDSPEYKTRKRSSSNIAYNWFWIIMLLLIATTIMFWLSGGVPVETMPIDGTGIETGDVGGGLGGGETGVGDASPGSSS